jgi:hypothetical protein
MTQMGGMDTPGAMGLMDYLIDTSSRWAGGEAKNRLLPTIGARLSHIFSSGFKLPENDPLALIPLSLRGSPGFDLNKQSGNVQSSLWKSGYKNSDQNAFTGAWRGDVGSEMARESARAKAYSAMPAAMEKAAAAVAPLSSAIGQLASASMSAAASIRSAAAAIGSAGAAAGAAIPAGGGGKTIQHASIINLDGRKVAEVVTTHQLRDTRTAMNAASFDSSADPSPTDHNYSTG